MFTNHFGHVLGKEEDLAAHRTGALQVTELTTSEQRVRCVGEVAIVSVRMRLSGTYGGRPASGDFRFTRVWALSVEQTWQVVAAHSGVVS